MRSDAVRPPTMFIYEYSSQEVDQLLPFRNAIFNQISVDHWEAMNCTGVVARDGEELVGFIPLQYREQCLTGERAAGGPLTIPVVYENAVGVAPGRRGQGIGTQMIEGAARFMADRADALMVIRNGERSTGYRFYRKTGHSDLMYAYTYKVAAKELRLTEEEGDVPSGQFVALERGQWLDMEPDLLRLYSGQYGRYGGGQLRRPGYWRMVLGGHVYRDQEWQLIAYRAEDRLKGYLVTVNGLWASTDDVYVYELIGEDDAAVERLIRHAAGLVRGSGTDVSASPDRNRSGPDDARPRIIFPSVSLANPIRSRLHQLGFAEEASTPHIMARILRPDRIYQRLARGSDLLQDLHLTVITPHRTAVVNDPPTPKHTVQLETKESMLARLFCCRLDLAAAVEMEWVRCSTRDPGLVRALSALFPFCDWVQWYTDYV